MKPKILLLRGINVGGHGKLPMADLRQILTDLGAEAVKTYIQSGNATFLGDLAASDIAEAIEVSKGFQPRVMLLNADKFSQIAAANPFPEAVAEGKTLHIWFPAGPFKFDLPSAETLRKENERISVSEHAIYLHAPDGIGRSKLAERVERLAGVACTARNWNTVAKLVDMIAEYD